MKLDMAPDKRRIEHVGSEQAIEFVRDDEWVEVTPPGPALARPLYDGLCGEPDMSKRETNLPGMMALAMLILSILAAPRVDASDIAPAEDQIAAAILAAPEDRRAGAGVLGYNADGKLVTLREGDNDLICLADKPGNDSFSVACYHRDLEPFMARGRSLSAAGLGGKERRQVRAKEVEDGKLSMPRRARALYVLNGGGFDSASGKVTDPYLRWVIYQPFATPATTGLSTSPSPGAPWLMYPGTVGAHIMINPPKAKK